MRVHTLHIVCDPAPKLLETLGVCLFWSTWRRVGFRFRAHLEPGGEALLWGLRQIGR